MQLVDVTNGLQYLHDHDFVHGDLKGVRYTILSLGGLELKCHPSGQYPYRFPASRSVSRLRAREGHWRSMHNHHAEYSGNGNGLVERTRILASANVWVWKEISEAATVKEYGYLRAGDDDTRGEYTGHISIIPSELMALSIGYHATSAILQHWDYTRCYCTHSPWRST